METSMNQAPTTADQPPGFAGRATDADAVTVPMQTGSEAGSSAVQAAEPDPDSQKRFGDLKQNLTNHWTVQNR
jgi:hypothetical protein